MAAVGACDFHTLNIFFHSQVLIVDLDVHQGDGTAFMFQDDPSVFTLSVHNAKNFPLTKQQSDLDVALADKVGDEEYLKMVVDVLPSVVDAFQPDLVLYDAGVSIRCIVPFQKITEELFLCDWLILSCFQMP